MLIILMPRHTALSYLMLSIYNQWKEEYAPDLMDCSLLAAIDLSLSLLIIDEGGVESLAHLLWGLFWMDMMHALCSTKRILKISSLIV